jgi:hypothetical protein
MSYIVIVTPVEGAGDFDVVGAFADKEDAITWMQQAFLDPKYSNHLFRIKEMRSQLDDSISMDNVDQHQKA